MTSFLKYSLIIISFISLSCDNQEEYPKPKSYLRIDFPKKEYYTISDSCCFIFKLPDYSSWEQKFKNYPTCSKTIIFPKFKAEVLCEYFKLNNAQIVVTAKGSEVIENIEKVTFNGIKLLNPNLYEDCTNFT